MDPKHVFVLLISILVACLWANVAAKRDLIEIKPTYEVVGNFEIGGDESHCLNRLAEMTSCSTEVVDFLIKRETNLNTSCCLAISTMANHCSPTTLNLFGFTPEVYMALRSHCDSTSSSPATATAPAPLAGSNADPLAK
ncbi:Egg cell-secreted protein 1.4 [Morella rubra]|uniref:Egg cell-secreted protein 1.4 n=1 Tax=Morella rubra TaxID=262757 RepID=A0A6A1VD19_9ROSI|nr:Egg cell-secreted protein 1.4 [Morella rubra]